MRPQHGSVTVTSQFRHISAGSFSAADICRPCSATEGHRDCVSLVMIKLLRDPESMPQRVSHSFCVRSTITLYISLYIINIYTSYLSCLSCLLPSSGCSFSSSSSPRYTSLFRLYHFICFPLFSHFLLFISCYFNCSSRKYLSYQNQFPSLSSCSFLHVPACAHHQSRQPLSSPHAPLKYPEI